MEEKKKRTYKRKKKEVKSTPVLNEGKPLVDYMQEAISTEATTMEHEVKPVLAHDVIDVKMVFPRLENESDEEYAKRFPKRAHPGDIGFDVTATAVEYDDIHDRFMYHTGIYCETAEGDGCFLMPRSGNSKKSAQLGNGIGLVETVNYRGELLFAFKNRMSLFDCALMSALWIWNMMPWYKKLFKKFDLLIDERFEWYKKNALHFAPYSPGDKIGQIVWMKFPSNINIELVDELSETERGTGGFGSTGK